MPLKYEGIVHQELLVQQLRSLFPNEKTYVNSRFHSKVYSGSNLLELDIWIPKFRLSFEFQDEYHYANTWYNPNSRAAINQRDNIKQELIRKEGISLVLIPCWWSGDQRSLAETICFQRPDLICNQLVNPISLNPPFGYFTSVEIPSVGELTYASFPANPKFFSTASWWIGEKYDGVRFCWHPRAQKVYSRSGNEFLLPEHLTASLPLVFVDGEFWFGRGEFLQTYPLVTQNMQAVVWHALRMVTFDAPESGFQKEVFEFRYAYLLGHISDYHPLVLVALRMIAKDEKMMDWISQNMIDDGGEGVILQQIGSIYEQGRTPALVKLKTAGSDREGIITSFDEQGVQIRLPSGITFPVPKEQVLTGIPAIGEIVTFSYDNNARRDQPVNPKITRIRRDITWDDVCYSFGNERKYTRDQGFVSQAQGYWTERTMRTHTENFAKSRHLDPHLADSWYLIPDEAFYKDKGGRIIAQKFGGFANAVQKLFPDIKFTPSSFLSSWRKMSNRRKFFEDYAKENSFDPLSAEDWYSQSKERILDAKEAARVVYYHNDSVTQALLDLFPEIGLEKFRLSSSWHTVETRRKFFESYAHSVGFDPLHPENWYSQNKENIMSTKGAKRVIFYHENSIARALLDLFPDIGLDERNLSHLVFASRTSWENVASRRELFEKYAKENGFDPLNPENWYLQPRKKILEIKGTLTIIAYYDYSVAKALLDCFPNIGLDISRFPSVWYTAESRRKFLMDFAENHGFDPLTPESWHSLPRENFLATKGAASVLSHHSGSLSKALVDLFPDINFAKPKATSSIQSRKIAFESVAREHGFDPLHAKEWYRLTRDEILSVEGVSDAISHYSGSLSKALLDLFPNIGLDASKFSWATPTWSDESKRRRFFEKIASDRNFDPRVAESWYKQPLEDIMLTKGASNVVSYHKRSAAQALLDLFPDIGLDKPLLWPAPIPSIANSRTFFEGYAKEHGFDPQNPDAWYLQSRHKIISSKGAWAVLAFHKNNISKALRACFPNIGLQKSRLSAFT